MASNKLDFSIIDEVVNHAKFITVLDMSTYEGIPSMPVIQVKFPGFTDYYSAPFVINSINKLTTAFLQYNDCATEFPDGLYHIIYSIDTNEETNACKYILRTVALNCNIQKLLSDVTVSNRAKLDELYELDKWLWAAKAQLQNSPHQANEIFKVVQKKVSKLINCN